MRFRIIYIWPKTECVLQRYNLSLIHIYPQWENYLLEIGGSDALLQDRHEKEYILNEFIPYLNLHVTLSEIEQSVSEKLGETDERCV